jgi:hypothetical protein
MDESLQELENELKRLRPRRPSASLAKTLERELGPVAVPVAQPATRRYVSATSLRSWKWVSWSLAGAAAALLIAFLVRSRQAMQQAPDALTAETASPIEMAPTMATSNRYEPVHASSVLYDLQESDPKLLPDRTEGREVRYRYVDTYTWRNPTTNASVRWSVPRDEVRFVRASLD